MDQPVLGALVDPEGLIEVEKAERGSVAAWRVRAGRFSSWVGPWMRLGCCWALHAPPGSQAWAAFLGPHLADELAPLAHADVFLTLGSLDAHPAPERVRLYYELGCDEGAGERPLSFKVAGPGGRQGALQPA